jgi:hypothetical protein
MPKPVFEKGEDAFVEQMQSLSVSGTPHLELLARAYREVLPAVVRWHNAEAARGTATAEVLNALPALLSSQVATLILNNIPDGKEAAKVMDAIKDGLDKEWRRTRAEVRERKPDDPQPM